MRAHSGEYSDSKAVTASAKASYIKALQKHQQQQQQQQIQYNWLEILSTPEKKNLVDR